LILYQRVVLAFLMSATIANLTACNKKDASPTSPVQSSADTSDSRQLAKFNAYIRSYNDLIGDQGLTHEYQVYRDANVSKKSSRDLIDVGTGLIAEQRDRLKVARTMPGSGSPEMDTAASKLIESLDPVISRLAG
jgi:hypothetical protein